MNPGWLHTNLCKDPWGVDFYNHPQCVFCVSWYETTARRVQGEICGKGGVCYLNMEINLCMIMVEHMKLI